MNDESKIAQLIDEGTSAPNSIAAALADEPLASPGRYINRELSWLAFNARVLDEADNVNHPLLERLRFLSISAKNLDEFQMVRVAGLIAQVDVNVTTPSIDGLSPVQQLAAIKTQSDDLVEHQYKTWRSLRGQLRDAGIAVVEEDELSKSRQVLVERLVREGDFPNPDADGDRSRAPLPLHSQFRLRDDFEVASQATRGTALHDHSYSPADRPFCSPAWRRPSVPCLLNAPCNSS